MAAPASRSWSRIRTAPSTPTGGSGSTSSRRSWACSSWTSEDRDEADTLGGLIFTLVDRVPTRGEVVAHPAGLEFEVLDADPRRIKRVRIRHRPPAD